MKIKQQNEAWLIFIRERYEALIHCKPLSFQNLVPSMIPEVAGVYLITARKSKYDSP